jgi:Exo-beta-D-glucosaminidase Ig-fold domain/Glycosyl hydrolases family 2/Glycosyl hydrolases family 2, sugar binding domain/F5/8 type C domain
VIARRWVVALLLVSASVGPLVAQEQTRGVGIYPGDPREDLAPELVPDTTTYRNLAWRRPAYHSSSYDYNLTAQLVTDGIKATEPPRTLAVTTRRGGVLSKIDRERAVDGNRVSGVDFERPGDWITLELAGGATPFTIDRVTFEAHTRRDSGPPPPPGRDWKWLLSGSDDGKEWTELGSAGGDVPMPADTTTDAMPWSLGLYRQTNPPVTVTIPLPAPSQRRFYRLTLVSAGGEAWALAEMAFFDKDQRLEVGGPYHFSSAWMSGGGGQQWVSVDLGAVCTFDRISLYWLERAAKGVLQVSDNGHSWRTLRALPSHAELVDDITLAAPERGRHVRVLMQRPTSSGRYVLTELEVYGRGGLVPRARPLPPPRPDGRQDLAGGAWRLQRDSLVGTADGRALSRVGYADADWLVATVPATVLSSYWNAGALPDPNFGDNQLMISDSFFCADFWYRTEFEAAKTSAGRRVFLNFDGVNWKADVFLNGETLGRIEGAFTRGRFDVTPYLRPGQQNALAVRVLKNKTPGSTKQKTLESPGLNGGALGADNPTFHSSVGWDWIPPVRGREVGIWNDVFLTTTGPATIEDPVARTTLPLPEVQPADVTLEATLVNHEPTPQEGVLRGRFGDVVFERPVSLAASATSTVTFDAKTVPGLHLAHPRLWWPNGYGEPNLYDVTLELVIQGQPSDAKSFRTGVRQFTYGEDGDALRIWINGRRFVGRGGNWGFPESNLRYRGREYDVAVRYHRDMNFTMIRNWVGQTGDDEFYEACDRHGIVIWQDFWLANPWDGPDPDDNDMFLKNVRDTILRIRNHPSIGLYCGRNEGQPPPVLEAGLRAAIKESHADVHYIPNSAWGPVSGGGPYWAEAPKFYFEERATPKLHSELGMPNIVSLESLKQMIPADALWPPGLTWGLHDFGLQGAQRLSAFRKIVEKSYGGADNAADWVELAQFVNYDGYRAMFEAQSRNRMGVLLWMSHPAWPSFVWQTYDYYFDPTAGYFGSKKGSEPLHIQWNPVTDHVEVVNYSAGNTPGLVAHAEIRNTDGSVQWTSEAALDSAEDSVASPIALEYPRSGLTPVHFVLLKLTRGPEIVSENFYWRGLEDRDFRALRTLPRAQLAATTRTERTADRYVFTTELRNTSPTPALMVRLSTVRRASGDRILPAFFSDNYVALMPGETRTIRTQVDAADARGEEPRLLVEGFNVARTAAD